MKRALLFLSVAAIFGLALVAHAGIMGSMSKSELSSRSYVNHLIGAEVKNPQGEELGTIKDFVYDKEGHATFAVLDHDMKSVAIPFSALSISGAKSMEPKVVLNADKEKLDAAPQYDAAKAKTDRKWAADVYRYFGQQPYWKEKGKEAPSTVPGSGGVGY